MSDVHRVVSFAWAFAWAIRWRSELRIDAEGADRAVLITPPPIPTGLRESSRIPTGFLLDSNKFSKKAFSQIFSIPPTGLLLDSYWTPTGFLLDSYWTPTELKQMSQTESNGSDTGFLLDSYWSITVTDMAYLTTLINLDSPSIFKKSAMFEYNLHTKYKRCCTNLMWLGWGKEGEGGGGEE